MTTDQIIILVQHLAWPVIALIAILALRPHLRELIQGASNLRELLDRWDELVKLLSSVATLGKTIEQVPAQLAELQGAQEVLIASREVGTAAMQPQPTTQAELETIWATIEESWRELRDSIKAFAQANGVEPYLMGRVGVANTMDALVTKGATNEDTANKIKDLSGKWQWMYRTTTPREDWLNRSLAENFVRACAEAKRALLERT